MTLPEPRATQWTTTGFTGAASGWAECRVRWKSGFDCRQQCVHENKGDHGQTGDELRLDMRIDDFALCLELMLSVRDGRVLDDLISIREWNTPARGGYCYVRPFQVAVHSAFPTQRDQLLTEPAECDLLYRGRCWICESSILQAETLWTPLDSEMIIDVLPSRDIEHVVLDTCGSAWLRMFDALIQKHKEARARWTALPQVCARCHGTGTVPIDHPNEP